MHKSVVLTILCVFASMADAQPQVPAPPQAPPAVLTYAEASAKAIERNSLLMTYVGISSYGKPTTYAIVCEIDSLPGYPAKCVVISYPEDGRLWWQETLDEHGKTLKAVTPPASPFVGQRSTPITARPDAQRGGSQFGYHAGHNCPNCGARQTTVSGSGPGGTHTHTCSRCGTSWFH